MSYFLWISYALVTLWAITVIIFYGSRPAKSVAWVLTALTLPFVGPLLYYLFGVNRKKFRFFRLRHSLKRQLYDITHEEAPQEKYEALFDTSSMQQLSQLIQNNAFLYPYAGNKVTLLSEGEKTFEVIFDAMRRAKKFIHLQYYMLEEGKLFERLCVLLKQKVEEGVEVRMLYDAMGSYELGKRHKKQLQKIGVNIYPILPLRFGNLLFTLNYRNHRKIVVIDGTIGFTGGVNVSDKYISADGPLGKWEDLHVQLEGPVVHSLHRVFIKDYHFASKEEGLLNETYLPKIAEKGNAIVQIVSGGPDSPQPAIMQQYIAMLHAAKKSVVITNPYFIPGVAFLESLKIVALSGVQVRLIVPKKTDSLMAKYSMFSQFEELLKVGVDIYLRNDFSHSKVMIVDEEVVSIGSGNFDYRSFEHNYETNALIYDKDIASTVLQSLEKFCKPTAQLQYDIFTLRPRWRKFLEGLAKFVSPLL